MAKITIKNTKSKNESAYKTGANLPNTKGVDFNAVNPGALTGAKKSDTKFNTMNLPIRGTNFQVSVNADSEKEFDNVSSIDAIYMESASVIINEDSSNSGDEPTPPTPEPAHYEFLGCLDRQTGLITLTPSGEGITLQEGDTVKFSFEMEPGLPSSIVEFDTVTATTFDTDLYYVDISSFPVNLFMLPKNTICVYNEVNYEGLNFLAFILYNTNDSIALVLSQFRKTVTFAVETSEVPENTLGIRDGSDAPISSVTIGNVILYDNLQPLSDRGIVVEESLPFEFKIATESIEIDKSINSTPNTYTISEGDLYYYVENWGTVSATGNKVDLYLAYDINAGEIGAWIVGIVIKS